MSRPNPTNNKLQVSLAPLLSIYKRQKLPHQRHWLLGYNTSSMHSFSILLFKVLIHTKPLYNLTVPHNVTVHVNRVLVSFMYICFSLVLRIIII